MSSTQLKLQWTIKEFSTHTVVGEFIESPFFEPSNKYEVNLRLFPNGFTEAPSGVNIMVYLKKVKLAEMNILYKFSMLNLQGINVYNKEIKGEFNKDSLFGFPEYVRRSYLTAKSNELLPNDELTISCELSISPIEAKAPVVSVDTKLSHDYSKMLENTKFHDVILCFGEKELKAHKNILSARSPVFEAMFEHDLEETRENRVNITDVLVEVFEQLLKYIYTGQVELDETFAAELLVAADKYGFESLKSQCEQWICSQIENDKNQEYVSSVVQLLLMADMQKAKLLKIKSIKYIVRNSNSIISTDKWTELMQTKPKLFNEVFNLIAQKLNTANLLDDMEIE